MPKSRGAKLAHRKQRTTASRSSGATRPMCENEILDYVMSKPELAQALLGKPMGEPPHPALQSSVQQLYDLVSRVVFMSHHSAGEDGGFMPTPGFLLLANRGEDGRLSSKGAVALELWGLQIPDGVAQFLRRKLQGVNRRDARVQFSLAVWVTGAFAASVPVHVFAVDLQGGEAATLVSRNERMFVPFALAERSIEMVRKQIAPIHDAEVRATARMLCDQEPPSDAAVEQAAVQASLDRYVGAVMMMNVLLGAVDKSHEKLSSSLEAERKAAAGRLEEALTKAQTRARAAVKAVKDNLRRAEERIRKVEAKNIGLHSRLAALQGAQATDTLAHAVPPAAEPLPTSGASTDAQEREASADAADWGRWQEVAEHQAEVIRQLRLALVHSNQADDLKRRAEELPELLAPRKLEELDRWAAENADRVIVLGRALNAAKKSTYHDEALAYRALDLLATTYRDVKLGLRHRDDLREECDQLGLDIGGSIVEAFGRAEGDAYYFSWRGRRRFLDQHLGKGTSRDPRYCFRVYYTWDEEESKVIIGWTPSHLPTRIT